MYVGNECATSTDFHVTTYTLYFSHKHFLHGPVFCSFYAIDGLFRERGFETLAYLLGVVAVYLYVAINFVRNPGTGSTYIFKLVCIYV